MAGTIVPWFRQQWLDANGAPLSLGTLETYETGTSTPLATYSDAALSVSNGTTITLNAGGFPTVTGVEVGIFLLPRAYRFVLKNSAGTTQRTIDGVYALQAASSVNLEIDGIAGESLSAGTWAYESDGSGGLTAGRWYKADSDLYYASIHPNIGFVPSAIASGATGTIRIGGVADNLSALSAGSTYYLSATAGAITATAPLNARSVGVARSATAIDLNISPRWLANPAALACQARLTLTSGSPVTTADVTGATSIFCAPYQGNRMDLFDGVQWKTYPFTEITKAIGTLTASLPYDVFVFDNAGTLTLEFAAWTNATTRATALTTQDGRYVKTGATTRLYLGTFYTTSTTQTEDSFAKRLCWNYYNRVLRPMRVLEATNTWNYTLATLQQANASAANQLDFVIGVNEVVVDATVIAGARNTNASVAAYVGVGLDSTTTNASGTIMVPQQSNVANAVFHTTATWRGFPGVGRHVLVWLEGSEASGTLTWLGDNGAPTLQQSGIVGGIWG